MEDGEPTNSPLLPPPAQPTLKRRQRCAAAFGLLSVLGLTAAVVCPLLVQRELHGRLDDEFLVDSESRPGFADWADTATNSVREVHMYVFAIDNADEFVTKKQRLRVREHGPFVFRKRQRKVDVRFNINADVVDYRLWTETVFDSERTHNLTMGKYSTDNVSFRVVDSFFWGQPPKTGMVLWRALNQWSNDTMRMFTTKTVAELKNGYGECPLCYPGLMPNEKQPPSHTYRTRIGRKDMSAAASYVRWRGMERLDVQCPWGNTTLGFQFCPESSCCGGFTPPWGTPPENTTHEKGDPFEPNQVAGTDGNQFAPSKRRWWTPLALTHASHLVVFVDFIWRHLPVTLVPNVPLEVYGLRLGRYHVDVNSSSSDNATTFPYNRAYHMDGPRAVINCTLVQQGAPIFFSNPHFLGAGRGATDRIEGLQPDPAKHATVFGIEPNSGRNVYSRQRMQVNVKVEAVTFDDNVTWFGHMMPGQTYAPLAWFDIVETITPAKAAQLRKGLQQANLLWTGSLIAGLSISVAAAVLAIALARRRVDRGGRAKKEQLPSRTQAACVPTQSDM